MKKIGLVLIVLLNSLLVFGNESISVGILHGPSSIPTGYMMENVKKIGDADITFEKFADPTALLPKLIKKEADIGFLPVNVAAKVFNSSNGAIVCCAITGNGNISLVTKDSSVTKLSDLINKKVYVAGHGATPDYLFRYILDKNNIKIKENGNQEGVELDFSIQTPQLAPALLSGKAEYVIVPEPFISVMELQSKDVKVPIDFQKEYKAVSGKTEDYPLTVLVATRDFAVNNSDLLIEFLNKYKESYEWTVKNPVAAGELSEKYNLGFKKAIANKAIPKSNYCFVKADEGKAAIENLLNLFLNNKPESIGGKLPSENFYFTGK